MIKKIATRVILTLLTAAVIFYLFVLPALTATAQVDLTWYSIAFGVFLYVQIWLLVFEYLYMVIARIYGFRKEYLFLGTIYAVMDRSADISKTALRTTESLAYVIFIAFIAWALAIYGFALAYTFTQTLQPDSFTQSGLSLFDFLYFSVVTAATVGYGDIAPKSTIAKLIVMAEISFSYLYTVFILAILANEVAGRRKEPNNSLQDRRP